MSDVHLAHIEMLYLLWLLPALIALYLYARHKRRSALERFVQADLLKHINVSVSRARRGWKSFAILAACAFVIGALVRPGWNPRPKKLERMGRDVVFIIDVSRSMLAEDLSPNRLERAKLAIRDCIERLEGDRVGLVAFAGTAVVKCPLTLDYGFFRFMLEDISVESIDRGGTMIGDAVRKALDEVFDDREKRYKDIILITDGEDHDSFPVEAAEEAGKRGIRIIAVGLGDENEGKRIPITDEKGNKTFLKYKGGEVWSRLDADTLRKMVNATPGGKYFNVATGAIDLGSVYAKLVVSAEKKELESKTVKRYEEKFQIFLALAFVLLCAEIMISERNTGKGRE
jgi:Ca-activated chloride channel family protein